MSDDGVRVPIAINVRKMIENIKEITGNHSEEDIHAMLKECSMDPNEATQKLLLQDPFHEVKRKRERKKENANNKDGVESRWRNSPQGSGRGGRTNFSPQYTSQDAVGGRRVSSGKDRGNQAVEKGVPTSQDTKTKERSSVTSSVSVIANGPINVASGSAAGITSTLAGINNKGNPISPVVTNKNRSIEFRIRDSGPKGEIKRDVGSQQHPGELNTVNPVETVSNADGVEISSIWEEGKMPSKTQGNKENQFDELSHSSTPPHNGSSISRPSSNYNKSLQQAIGPQKVGSNKEWKPKPTNSFVIQGSTTVSTADTSEVPPVTLKVAALSEPAPLVPDLEEATSTEQKNPAELHHPRSQLVILPDHIYVPESERTKLSFGSFDFSFGVATGGECVHESDSCLPPVSEISQVVEETAEELAASTLNTDENSEGDCPDRPQSPMHVSENLLSTDGDVSSNAIQDYSDLKQDTALPSGGQPYSVVHTSPNCSLGVLPPMVGSQLGTFENIDSQARDVSRLPSFVVQQPFDPASYYAQIYRSGADGDGRLSPFPSSGVALKYNGNVAVLPPSGAQSPQEGGLLPTAGPAGLATQVSGLMQSSIAMSQQPVPIFRPPTGLHLSHYPPNYIPYGHYFSPFYVPPPPIHQFLGNNAFPQQPQAGTVYTAPPPPATGTVKYPLPPYKAGTNSGTTHVGMMPSGYGLYGSSQSGYIPGSAVTAGQSTTNEDLGGSQFRENNVYITGPQSDGSAVWVAAPGRDITSLPANSLYNLPPQNQHVAFTPTQGGHGSFAGIYHPPQAITAANVHPVLQQSQALAGTADMVGPGGGVYQQPQQHSQINWPSNY